MAKRIVEAIILNRGQCTVIKCEKNIIKMSTNFTSTYNGLAWLDFDLSYKDVEIFFLPHLKDLVPLHLHVI